MEKKRFIFDLDFTLLSADFSLEKDYFKDVYDEKSSELLKNLGSYLREYEKSYMYYNMSLLSKFLSDKTGLFVSEKVIDGWIKYHDKITDQLEEGVIETLEFLKGMGHSQVVLTNWFEAAQVGRLKRSGLYDYFDGVYAGDSCLKPNPWAYFKAAGSYSSKDCVVVGDNFNNDYIGPRKCGIESILYDKKDEHDHVVKIKRIDKLIDIYRR